MSLLTLNISGPEAFGPSFWGELKTCPETHYCVKYTSLRLDCIKCVCFSCPPIRSFTELIPNVNSLFGITLLQGYIYFFDTRRKGRGQAFFVSSHRYVFELSQ